MRTDGAGASPDSETARTAKFVRTKFRVCGAWSKSKTDARSKKAAFTLAEVLITLGIIGVVAALTLPSLVANYKEKQKVTQLKKAYSVLSQAFQYIVAEHGPLDSWDLVTTDTGETDENNNAILDNTSQVIFVNYLKEYLKSVDYTDQRTDTYNLSGVQTGTVPIPDRKIYSIQLEDGVIISVGWFNSVACKTSLCSDIWIVLPGKQWQTGVTAFNFWMYKDHITPARYRFDEYCDTKNKAGVYGPHQGRGCTQWVLENENMDYLHCEGLGQNGKNRCK